MKTKSLGLKLLVTVLLVVLLSLIMWYGFVWVMSTSSAIYWGVQSSIMLPVIFGTTGILCLVVIGLIIYVWEK